ncbi:sigma-70 family RNA polymerase sigma factor [Actinospica sp. MGRD01-02]|uniref:Sigma-70 family RNA polymerase sigma factor n=1 Tax=Actinospica acidithermotolerans TaxID=2828514 RepID=A0A941EEP3_9ACTN|nr:sigma-70 family RNA polymerase sigma factor [Actinospica acidithermotolerans]MBR7827679.1 sigma-70 family RNA polymerase sigma factor [Actinospica acidithermotolerans]
MPSTRTRDEYAARYSVLYKEHNAQLVAYARSLTGSAATAEDLAAEAHFRVWRRIQAGHRIDNVAAYLTTTVRNLAAGLARGQREIARDVAEMPRDPARGGAATADPEHRASHVDLISRLLKELPDRWAKALWYAEVEDLPMEEVGAKIGANAGTTAVVLTRARERLRQAFLLAQPGAPLSGECAPYWKHMATVVRGTASARRTRNVTEHCDGCDDCRSRMLALTAANTQLPALLGPALLAGVLAGGAWFGPAVAGADVAAGTAARAGSRAGRHARVGAKARIGLKTRGGAKARIDVKARIVRRGMSPAKTVVAGAVAAVGIAATVATLALATSDNPTAAAQSALQPHATAIQPTSGPATTSAAASASATLGAPASASAAATAAATQPPASTRAAAPATSAGTTAATSAAATQAPSGALAQGSQPQASATTAASSSSAAAAAPASAPATSATTPPVPSTSASASAGPVASDTPTASPSESSSPAAIPTPSPSETVSGTPSADPTCTFGIVGLCFATITGDN